MKRRQVLSTGGFVLALLSLSGCTDADEPESEPSADGSDDGTADRDTDADVRAAIHAADESIDDAVDEFEAATGTFDDPLSEGQSIETRPIVVHLDDAEEALAGVADDATDDQLETIGALEDVIEFLRELTASMSALGDALDDALTGFEYVDRDRYGDAISAFERAEANADEAGDRLAAARSTLDGVDTDAPEVDEIDRVELEVVLDDLESALVGVKAISVGFGEFTAGMDRFVEGIEQFEDGRPSASVSTLSDASLEFRDATTTFRDAESEVPAEMRGDFIEMSCSGEALADGVDLLIRGIEAEMDGDHVAADEYYDEADDAFVRCEGNEIAPALF